MQGKVAFRKEFVTGCLHCSIPAASTKYPLDLVRLSQKPRARSVTRDPEWAGPLCYARRAGRDAGRGTAARSVLVGLDATDLPIAQIAFASGFGSLRQHASWTAPLTFSPPPSYPLHP